jgi:hypothetical protein
MIFPRNDDVMAFVWVDIINPCGGILASKTALLIEFLIRTLLNRKQE